MHLLRSDPNSPPSGVGYREVLVGDVGDDAADIRVIAIGVGFNVDAFSYLELARYHCAISACVGHVNVPERHVGDAVDIVVRRDGADRCSEAS